MLRAAVEAALQQPPAIVQRQGDDKPAVLSVRMTEGTLEALARFAIAKGHDAAARDCGGTGEAWRAGVQPRP
jgi:hypothetical protein